MDKKIKSLPNIILLCLIALLTLLTSGCAPAWEETIKRGDIAEVTTFLKNDTFLQETNSSHPFIHYPHQTPLMLAAGEGNLKIIKLLLDKGADPNTKIGWGNWTALSWAALKNKREAAQLLINSGANVDDAMIGLETIQQKGARWFRDEATIGIRILNQLVKNRKDPAQIAANPVKTSSDIDTAIPSGKSAGKYDVAVVIGNANYSATGSPNVDFALQDAQVIRQYLVKAFGYDPANIIYLENATLTKLNEVFGTSDNYQGKLYKWVKPGQSNVFIYYVGHGAPDQQSGEGYFVPVDANPQYISTSGYKLSTFYENLSRIPAIKKTVVIDACFSGSSANGQLLKGVSGLTARLKSEPKASVAADLLLTSAGMDQVASWYPEKGHSLFTYFFLKGIQGEADVNKDGKTTMGEMKIYLNEHVPYMARRLTGNEQQPVLMGKDEDEITVLVR